MNTVAKTMAIGLCAALSVQAQKVSMTPPMGWNSWNTFYGNINESLIKGIIDVMGTNGMRAAGYIYVNLDDNWMANPARDASGNLRADPTRFPNGIKSLSDYAHSKGMKLGIYGDRGSMTCMNVPQSGSYGKEAADAKTFASWGIDYVKYDNCNPVGQMQSDYTTMGKAIAASGRQMVYSVCAWQTQEWMAAVGNLWRSTDDITSEWLGVNNVYGRAIMTNLDGNADKFIFTRPGAFSDPDMLEVGTGKLTTDENKAHFGLWALMAAPLIAGNDVRSVNATNLAILTNSDIIAIDQDPAGIQGRRIIKNGDFETWVKPLGTDYNAFAVGLFNRSGSASNMTIKWSDLQLDPTSVTVRDAWAKKDLGNIKDAHTVSVPSHGLALFKVTGTRDPNATTWVSDRHIHSITNAWKLLGVDKSVAGNGLKIGTKTYAKGLGTNSPSTTVLALRKKFDKFQSDIGIDAETSAGSVVFQVFGDGRKLYESPVMKGGAAPVAIDVPVAGVDSLSLVVTDAGDGNTNDHGDWAGAKLTLPTAGALPRSQAPKTWRTSVQGDRLVLDRTASFDETLRIHDLQGREALSRRVSGSHVEIPLEGLARGIHTVRLGDAPSDQATTFYRD
ncbi:MAG: NPCBM/NEW2 domain-containing protein [Fibrobacteres bacterium]|nr:NPCBM/NEW2 domain-containing protein [Fibrobacterota bacterium]